MYHIYFFLGLAYLTHEYYFSCSIHIPANFVISFFELLSNSIVYMFHIFLHIHLMERRTFTISISIREIKKGYGFGWVNKREKIMEELG